MENGTLQKYAIIFLISQEKGNSVTYIINPPKNIPKNTTQSTHAIGEALWQSLGLEPDVFKPTREVLDIIIESDNPQTLQLPWELLYHPIYGFLAQHPNFTLSRKIPNLPNSSTPLEKRPLRVLFFSTLPDDIGIENRLSVEREEDLVVIQTLLPFRQEGLVEISVQNDGRFESLKKLIEQEKPDIVFLSGHSSYENGKGSFVFENERGLRIDIYEDELNSAFVGSSVECVVLSSCQSAMADDEMLESGLVRSLAFYGIKNVIGMRESIDDRAGVVFAKHFLEQVAKKKSIAFAVQKARDEIHKLENFAQEHWHLPILISQDINRPLVDWDFDPKAPSFERLNQKLNQILYPNLYIGRRKEFRRFYDYFYGKTLTKLLLYGEGGIGKTAMVAKFGVKLRTEGYKVFDYSIKHGGDFEEFMLDIELELSEDNVKKFTRIKEQCSNEACKVKRLAKLLLEEHKKIAFIFDNLEDIQDPTTKELTDEKIKTWIETLSSVENVVVLMTSRWKLPNCEDSIAVNRPLKSDFLYFVATQNIKFSRPEKLDKVFETLGGNFRGVELFIRAIEGMNSLDEEQFLAKLSKATREIQIDMSIEQILSYLSKDERELLEKITVYEVPIPQEGVRKIALDLSKEALGRLVSFSLVEESYNAVYEVNEYQVSALVFNFIKDEFMLSDEVKTSASDYQVYQFINERRNINQSFITYHALVKAERQNLADEFILKWISKELNYRGQYITLLMDWLFPLQESENIETRCQALVQIGIQYFYLGDYEKAITYSEVALNTYLNEEDKDTKLSLFNNLYLSYRKIENFELASDYLDKALNLATELDDISKKLSLLINLAEEYSSKDKYEDALIHAQTALDISKEIKNKFSECTVLNNMANYYIQTNDMKRAKKFNKKSLKISYDYNYQRLIGVGLLIKANIRDKENNLIEALEILQKALEIFTKMYDRPSLSLTLFRIGMNGLYQKREGAMLSFASAYLIAKKIKYLKVLNELKKIENKLNLTSSDWDKIIKDARLENYFNGLLT